MKRPSLAAMKRAVDQFNGRHKLGDPLWAYRGQIGDNPIAVTLRTPAEILGGHTPVAWVDGTSGCIALTHLRPRSQSNGE